MTLDSALFGWLNGFVGRSSMLDLLGTDWAKYGPGVLGVLVAGAWFYLPGDRTHVLPRRLAAIAVIAALVGLGIAQVIGHLWFRERPYVGHITHLLVSPSPDPSFPSDHAVGAFALATPFLLDWRTRRYGALLLLGATALAVARVFIGTHYPSDVAAGALLGGLVAWGITAATRYADQRFPKLWVPLRLASRLTDRAEGRTYEE